MATPHRTRATRPAKDMLLCLLEGRGQLTGVRDDPDRGTPGVDRVVRMEAVHLRRAVNVPQLQPGLPSPGRQLTQVPDHGQGFIELDKSPAAESYSCSTSGELMTLAHCGERDGNGTVDLSTLPPRVWIMANGTCRRCDRPAEAGPYCNPCAADVMAKALNPFHGGRRKRLPGQHGKLPPRPAQTPPRPSAQPPLFSP